MAACGRMWSLVFVVLCCVGIAEARSSRGHSILKKQPLFTLDKLPTGCDADLTQGPSRSDFPEDFVFGSATAAYQIEGAASEDGRGPSIWDVFCKIPGKIFDNSSGDIACDSYHKYEDDVALSDLIGMDAYRFSISWSRVLPTGYGEPNPAGIAYYNRLIDALLAVGVQPTVTLYHWDLPDGIQQLGGWLNTSVVEYYRAYADLCFDHFGDRVKTWVTHNEPMEQANGGYGAGYRAPGRCTDRATCSEGDSTREPYIVAHNILLSHLVAVDVYRTAYQARQGGKIGIVLNIGFNYPLTQSPEDIAAAQRGMLFTLGWWFDPIFFGDYPDVMKQHIGDRLPVFHAAQKAKMKGSADFLGLNYYTASYVKNAPKPEAADATPMTDSWSTRQTVDVEGNLIGDTCNSTWLYIVPKSIYEMVMWTKERYNNIPMYITENGVSEPNDNSIPIQTRLCDRQRVKFHADYLFHLSRAIKDGANVQQYYAWSLLDNFEWAVGYLERFGIVFVDFNDPERTRYPRASAVWFNNFLRGNKAVA